MNTTPLVQVESTESSCVPILADQQYQLEFLTYLGGMWAQLVIYTKLQHSNEHLSRMKESPILQMSHDTDASQILLHQIVWWIWNQP